PYFSCLTVRRPHGSTLVPYTTLFRSCRTTGWDSPPRGRGEKTGEARLRGATGLGKCRPYRVMEGALPSPARHRPHGRRDGTLTLDRKSTRLNSSHVKISYAVFCLKKK